MYLESVATGETGSLFRDDHLLPPDRPLACVWTIIVPFFNESRFLKATLESLAAQNRPFILIMIDNGSTDGSAKLASAECRRLGIGMTLVSEPRAGKVHALAAGLERVETRYVATCDADTLYPHDYLARAGALLARRGRVAAGAYYVDPGASRLAHFASALHMTIVSRLVPSQCHTGGAGQVFCTDSLRRAGGFNPSVWNYVLEDHEIIHRVNKFGHIGYGPRFWCTPSPRPRDRDSIRWTLVERLRYHFTPRVARDGFFYSFLGERLQVRRLTSDRIRERVFQEAGAA